MSTWWTSADQAEAEALLWALVSEYWQHRERCEACRSEPCARYEAWETHHAGCRACQGDAPLTFGSPCPERRRFLDEHHDCARCNPCPSLQRAIAAVCDWHEARRLLSTAEYLRELQDTAA